jgi:hypothetical protein
MGTAGPGAALSRRPGSGEWSRSQTTTSETTVNDAVRKSWVWADAMNHRFDDGEANEQASIGQVMHGRGLDLQGADYNDLASTALRGLVRLRSQVTAAR